MNSDEVPLRASPTFSSKSYFGAALILICVLLVGGTIVYLARKSQPAKPSPETAAPTSEQVAVALLTDQKIAIPKITAQAGIGLADLPADLKTFAFPEAQNLVLEKLVFAGEKAGYKIAFVLTRGSDTDEQEMFGAYNEILRAFQSAEPSWKFAQGGRATRAAFLVHTNPSYEAQSVLKFDSETKTAILAELIFVKK